MKETDWRKTLEVIVKGLVAVVVGLAGLYLLGWVLSLLGGLLLGFAGIVVALLRWLVPIAIIVGVVYFVVTQLQGKTAIATSPAVRPEVAPVKLDAESEPKPIVLEAEAVTKAVELEVKPADVIPESPSEPAATKVKKSRVVPEPDSDA
jgi:uncharacterized protein (DUF58 family)